LYSENNIDVEGAKALAKNLKGNTTLTNLDLGCKYKLEELSL
jgi:16S rRNA G1207 methylase RsmC